MTQQANLEIKWQLQAMKFSVPNLQIRLMLALAALFAAIVALLAGALTPLFCLEVSMKSSRGGNARIFYDIGEGINKRDSAQLTLSGASQTLYRFALPEGEYRAFRIRPVDRDNAEIALRGVRIVDLFGHLIRDFPAQDIIAGHGISRREVVDDEVRLGVGPGEREATLLLNPGTTLSLRAESTSIWLYQLRLFLLCFVPLSLAGIVWLRFAPPIWSKVRWRGVARQVVRRGRRQMGKNKCRRLPALLPPKRYCFCVVVVNDPGVGLPMSEFPWKESMAPPLGDNPVVLLAMVLSETRIEEPALALRPALSAYETKTSSKFT